MMVKMRRNLCWKIERYERRVKNNNNNKKSNGIIVWEGQGNFQEHCKHHYYAGASPEVISQKSIRKKGILQYKLFITFYAKGS